MNRQVFRFGNAVFWRKLQRDVLLRPKVDTGKYDGGFGR